MKIKKYSYSQLNLFNSCPLKYKLSYIDKIKKKDEGVESFLGKQVHLTLEWIYKKISSGRSIITIDEIKRTFDGYWTDNVHSNLRLAVFTKNIKRRAELMDYYSIGLNALAKYSSDHGPHFNHNVLAVEQRIDFMIGCYSFGGIIDRIDIDKDNNKKFNIIDYKTGKKRVTEKKFLMDLQMGIYYLGLKSIHPDFEEINLMHYYLVSGEEIKKKISKNNEKEYLEYENKITSKVVSNIETLNDAIQSNNFNAKESTLCNWCYYWKECSAKQKKKESNPAIKFD